MDTCGSGTGIGDQILFLSVMEEAISEFGNIFLIVEARMKSLIERSFPKLQVGLPGLLESWQNNSFKKNGYIPLGSLPGRYRQSVESFTNYKKAFLQVNGDLYVQYQQQLKSIANGRPIVGISWSGGYWAAQKRAKGWQLKTGYPFSREELYASIYNMETLLKKNSFLRKKF